MIWLMGNDVDNMKQIFKRLKHGLPEGSTRKLRTILKWFLFGVSESYSVRMGNKYPLYSTWKKCGVKTDDLYPCDAAKGYSCWNCPLGK